MKSGLNEIDYEFASFMQELSDCDSFELKLACMLVSNHISKGDICLDIPTVAGKKLSDIIDGIEVNDDIILPPYDKWISDISGLPVVGKPHEQKPLVLDKYGRLYLTKYWEYENKLSENIRQRLHSIVEDINHDILKNGLNRLFDKQKEFDWQKFAAASSVLQRFTVISGGPGTGKTTIAVKILLLIIEQALPAAKYPQIALCAPTGKAAARLADAVHLTLRSLNATENVKQQIPQESFTIHRLLAQASYKQNTKLPYDIVVIDESSMADISLMYRLFEAIPLTSRIILIGDKDQLASVEAGAAFGDICDTGKSHKYSPEFARRVEPLIDDCIELKTGNEYALADSLVVLRKSFRFDEHSGIGMLSSAIREGDNHKVLNALNNSYNDINYSENINSFEQKAINGYKKYFDANNSWQAIESLKYFIVLCPYRHGFFGINNINQLLEKSFVKKGFIIQGNDWYKQRPLIINKNDYNLKLFNGDIGVIFNEKDSEERNYFYCMSSQTDNYAGNKESLNHVIRKILPARLPDHDTAFALTVHKSQGSEYDHVLLILPDEKNPMLTRELLYTAVTRARKKIEIIGKQEVIEFMVSNPTIRRSGLRDSLWS